LSGRLRLNWKSERKNGIIENSSCLNKILKIWMVHRKKSVGADRLGCGKFMLRGLILVCGGISVNYSPKYGNNSRTIWDFRCRQLKEWRRSKKWRRKIGLQLKQWEKESYYREFQLHQ
jgi:hypothetical protein